MGTSFWYAEKTMESTPPFSGVLPFCSSQAPMARMNSRELCGRGESESATFSVVSSQWRSSSSSISVS